MGASSYWHDLLDDQEDRLFAKRPVVITGIIVASIGDPPVKAWVGFDEDGIGQGGGFWVSAEAGQQTVITGLRVAVRRGIVFVHEGTTKITVFYE